jgi:hypothetical protein
MSISVFGSDDLVGYSNDTDHSAIVVGTQIAVINGDSGATLDGVRIFPGTGAENMAGCYAYVYSFDHTAILHSDAELVAVKAFPTGLAHGEWNEVLLDDPIDIDPFPSGTYYVVAVYLPNGGYAFKAHVFDNEVDSPDDGNLTATTGGDGLNNGLFKGFTPADPSEPPSTIQFDTFNHTHYGVDALVTMPSGGDSAPANTVEPAITGTATTGNVLTCNNGSWSGSPSPTFTKQWKRDGANISGETGNTYTLVGGDEGHSIKCTVTATNTQGSASADSNTVTPTAPSLAPANTVAPAVSGSLTTGSTLTTTNGTWTHSPTGFTYQWQRNGVNITDATDSTYTITSDDIGKSIRCVVTATNDDGSGSANSNAVTPANPSSASNSLGRRYRSSEQIGDEWVPLYPDTRDDVGRNRYFPEDYGAKRDAFVLQDVVISSGTKTHLSSASASFTTADVGKAIMVDGAGSDWDTDGLEHLTTIASVIDENTVVLTDAATSAVAGERAVYGTDDTQAFLDCMADAYAKHCDATGDGTNNAEMKLSVGGYMFKPDLIVGGPTLGNMALPIWIQADTDQKFSGRIVGVDEGSAWNHWNQQTGQHDGVCLYACIVGQDFDDDWGVPSFIGGPTVQDVSVLDDNGMTGHYTNVLFSYSGFKIIAPANPCFCALNLQHVAQFSEGNFTALTGRTASQMNARRPTNQQGMGRKLPDVNENDNCVSISYGCQDFYYAGTVTDHLACLRWASVYCVSAGGVFGLGSVAYHGATIVNMSVEEATHAFETDAPAGCRFPLVIEQMNIETSHGTHIVDQNNALVGRINFSHNELLKPSKLGGQNIVIEDMNRYLGPVTGGDVLAVPATTVEQVNDFGRSAMVQVTGGTVTKIEVDGVDMGVTSGWVPVPNGHFIKLTYSVAPTWLWVLM